MTQPDAYGLQHCRWLRHQEHTPHAAASALAHAHRLDACESTGIRRLEGLLANEGKVRETVSRVRTPVLRRSRSARR